MTEILVALLAVLAVTAAAAVGGPRLGVASPLMLVAVGVAASLLPSLGSIEVEPEWILEGLLPPLLYSSAVSMPAMNFRREFTSISALSVTLVIATSLALGLFFMWAVPGLGFAWGVALGAIVSPTDAVATSIVKRHPVSKRVISMLDGESLINDASALVLLRTAIVGTAATFSLWGAAGTFAYSVIVAVLIGGAIGMLNLKVRARVKEPTVSTVISFMVPFAASLPAELLGASGLVAAVVAGLVAGIRAPREISPQNRLSDTLNWRTMDLVLESIVFLLMGLQLRSVVTHVQDNVGGTGTAALIALAALGLTLAVRTAFVGPLLVGLKRKAARKVQAQERLVRLRDKIDTAVHDEQRSEPYVFKGREFSERQTLQVRQRIARSLADIDYFVRAPLGWREGAVVVWAGMRGAVTVAAVQTLPAQTPHRSLLVLIAFLVALFSLLLQGGTMGLFLRIIAPPEPVDVAALDRAERAEVLDLLRERARAIAPPEVSEDAARETKLEAARTHRLEVLAAQRAALLDARADGRFDADVLESELANLDATEIAIELRGRGRL
ncbi:cation:proton antiporter [Demequina capsici]|uniref:Cation:proton antiporter n=1 Tax=Demequina capsici TaxID=3075620 RepID=A0AA96FBQ3_9MICO|nr:MULTISPECIES: cation:proton antiporter [unclassified Demequina]WNM24409.1 cation:proton antiporter [Demequina sp. OYTSA14]WNM27243.1 cation:proton antiporter [Demequina sp. PMTSA13]